MTRMRAAVLTTTARTYHGMSEPGNPTFHGLEADALLAQVTVEPTLSGPMEPARAVVKVWRAPRGSVEILRVTVDVEGKEAADLTLVLPHREVDDV